MTRADLDALEELMFRCDEPGCTSRAEYLQFAPTEIVTSAPEAEAAQLEGRVPRGALHQRTRRVCEAHLL